MTPTSMRWRELPTASKRQWLSDRRRIVDFVKTPAVPQRDSRQIDEMTKTSKSSDMTNDEDDEEAGASSRYSIRIKKQKKRGAGVKKTSSDSMDFNFIPYNINNRIIYEYFDDPNELCERLRLLVSSRKAGNTNHMQEINSIIEELRELEYII